MSSAFKSVTAGLGLSSGIKQPGVPAIIPPRDFVDEIFGTSVRTVDTPNGKQTVIGVNYSPEDQARLDKLQTSYDSYMADLDSLTSMASAIDIPAFSPVITATREDQRLAREDAYKQRSSLEEETLAQRGVADSSSATEVRQQRGVDLTKQASADERAVILLAEDLRNNAVTRDMQGLQFSAGELQQDKVNRATSAQNLMSNQLAFYGQDNNIANANYANQMANYQAKVTQQNQIFKNLTGLAMAAGTAGAGGGGAGALAAGGAGGGGVTYGSMLGGGGVANFQNLSSGTNYLTTSSMNNGIQWNK